MGAGILKPGQKPAPVLIVTVLSLESSRYRATCRWGCYAVCGTNLTREAASAVVGSNTGQGGPRRAFRANIAVRA